MGGYTIQLYKCFEQVVTITTIDGILIKKRLTIIRMGHERDNRRGRIIINHLDFKVENNIH